MKNRVGRDMAKRDGAISDNRDSVSPDGADQFRLIEIGVVLDLVRRDRLWRHRDCFL